MEPEDGSQRTEGGGRMTENNNVAQGFIPARARKQRTEDRATELQRTEDGDEIGARKTENGGQNPKTTEPQNIRR